MGGGLARNLGALAILLAVLGLVGLSTWSAEKANDVNTVTAIQVADGRVHLSVAGRVFTTDLQGNTLGEFQGADGQPWRTDMVSSITEEPDGLYLVGELQRPEVAEFDSVGDLTGTIRLPFVPRGRAQAAAIGNRIFVADTMGHQVAIVDRDGSLHASVPVGYPNGANVVQAPGGPAVVFVSTLQSQVYAVDGDLHTVSLPLVDQINRLAAQGQGLWDHKSIIDIWVTPDASRALLSLSRSNGGDCAFVSVTDKGRVRVLGDSDAVRPAPSLDPDEMMALQAVSPVPGRVLAVSPRASAVLSFTTPDDQAAPFCSPCHLPELLPHARGLEDALTGFTWPNGTQVSGFGDDRLQDGYLAAWNARARYRSLGQDARTGLYVLVALLLMVWILSRVSASDRGSQLPVRLAEIFRVLIGPAAGLLLAALLMVLGAAAVGAAVGRGLAGTAGVIVGGGLAAWAASRLWITPWLVRHQPPARARAAFQVYYGHGAPREIPMAPGETLRYATFALPVRRGLERLEGVASGALDSDLFDIVTSAIPRPVLLVRTSLRLLVVKCSAWGSPLADPAVLEVASAEPAAPGLVLTHQGGRPAAFRLGSTHGGGERLVTGPPTYLCLECGRPEGTCAHRGPPLARAMGLSMVFPGLGQLAQRRFGPGRLLAGLTVLALVALGHVLVPQLEGTLPWNPAVVMGPAASLVALWLVALAELSMDARLSERRGQVARGL